MVTDNGLLISHVARKNQIPIEEARLVVNEYIDSLIMELREKDAVSIDEVGTISKDPVGNLTFEALSDKNYRIQSFGLPAIEIPQSAIPSEIPCRTVPPPLVPVVSKKRKRIPLAAIIISLILIGAGVFYFTGLFDRYLKPLFLSAEPTLMDNSTNDDKIVFGQPVPAEEDTLVMAVDKQLAERSLKGKALYYKEPEKTEQKQPEATAEKAEPAVTLPQAIQTGDFHIVAGSFLIPGNADRQKNTLEKKGYTPRIIQKDDEFFYVSLQAFNSKETAVSEMQKLSRELNLPLWVMKK